MAFSISLIYTNSSFLWDLDESPGPIFIASQLILIQSDVVGEENVSMPEDRTQSSSRDLGGVAEDLLCRFLAFRRLLHML